MVGGVGRAGRAGPTLRKRGAGLAEGRGEAEEWGPAEWAGLSPGGAGRGGEWAWSGERAGRSICCCLQVCEPL